MILCPHDSQGSGSTRDGARAKDQGALWLLWAVVPSASQPSPSQMALTCKAERPQHPWPGSSEQTVIKIASVMLHRGGGWRHLLCLSSALWVAQGRCCPVERSGACGWWQSQVLLASGAFPISLSASGPCQALLPKNPVELQVQQQTITDIQETSSHLRQCGKYTHNCGLKPCIGSVAFPSMGIL